MTFSICAYDPETQELGVAAATGHFAVGVFVPHIKAGVGAVATQANTNPLLGMEALRLMEEGQTPEQTIATLSTKDDDFNSRQIHMIDAHGRMAGFTGNQCIAYAGYIQGHHMSAAGNMLTSDKPLLAAIESWKNNHELPIADRLMQSLGVCAQKGGDMRGLRSAAIKVYQDAAYPSLDIRVDHHQNPLLELNYLLKECKKQYVQNFWASRPKKI